MSKIKNAFEKGNVFIPFITCGDPSLDITEKLVYGLEEAGAGIIELGIPFSDPTAEGPVIQAASKRALEGGASTDRIFEMVARIRKNTDIPLVFMTYANVVYSYGRNTSGVKAQMEEGEIVCPGEPFLRQAKKLGIDGLILPDVPFEEKEEFDQICMKYGIDLISMIAPTSSERIQRIAGEARGFLYCVSSLGVTGMRSEISSDISEMIRTVKAHSDIPCAVGFGISTPKQAAVMAKVADGVIAGSKFVKLCQTYGSDCVPFVSQACREMVQAMYP